MECFFSKYRLIFVFLLGLSACSSSPEPRPLTGLSYVMSPQMQLRVSRIEVSKGSVLPQKETSLEQLFPIPPGVMVQQWIRDRFSPAGGEGVAEITLEEASVSEKRLPGTPGLKGLFTTDQSERYDVRAAVKIEIKDARGYPLGCARAAVSVGRSVSEDMTFNARQHVFIALMEDLMNRLNDEIEKNMRAYLAKYIQN